MFISLVYLVTVFAKQFTDKTIVETALAPAHIAAATYCVSRIGKLWDCHTHCQQPQTRFNIVVTNFEHILTGTFGSLTINHESKVISVAFRGNLSPLNILQDVKLLLKPLNTVIKVPGDGFGAAAVHSGFLKCYKAVQKEVLANLQETVEAYPSFMINFVGHSLGATLSQMAALDAYHNLKLDKSKIVHYSFNSPRVGNKEYADLITFKTHRFTQGADIISRLPFQFLNYEHPNFPEHWENKKVFYTCEEQESPECINSVKLPYFDLISTHLNFASIKFGPLC